ncbi:DUF4190 domain-containing protein [Streptomyces sp. NPDC091272]|uniref:DUF4190 domain-containing protein n=1 Tax=Streptomyces sp. NPDC091272 TaxID=3365981 RepID=UPI00380ADBD8
MAIPPPPPEQPWNQPQQPGGPTPPPEQPWTQPMQPGGPPPRPVPPAHQAYGTPYPSSAYGAQPYGTQPGYGGPQPYGAPPAPPRTNGMAIASLVTGIVCCVPVLGLILGLVALSQIKRRGDAGKGMAVAGIVLSSLSVVLVLVGIVTGALTNFRQGFEDGMNENRHAVEDLRTGQCFDTPDGSLEGTTYDVSLLDCGKPHDAEVFGTFDLAESRDYPGDERISTVADQKCATAEKKYTGGGVADADSYYLMPDARGWRLGDRGVTCVFGNESGAKLTGSLRGTGTGGDGGSTGGTGGTDGGESGGTTGGSEDGGAGGDGGAGAGQEV